MDKQITVNISTSTLFKILAIVFFIVFLYFIKSIVMVLLAALILTAAFEPWVNSLAKRHIPRTLGILAIYVILLSIMSFAFILIVPPISKEVSELSVNFPLYYEKIITGLESFHSTGNFNASDQLQQGLSSLGQNLPGTFSNIISTLIDIFGGIFSVLLVLVITFYLTVQEEALKGFIKSVTPAKLHPYMVQLFSKIQVKMGQWLRGQLLLSAIIFAMTFIGLTILNVPYALVLAFIAGILEAVPYLGPWIAAVPAVLFGFMQSPIMGISVAILYLVIQELENHLIVPKVMSKAVGLNPIVVIFAILIGARLSGIGGALLAVPVATGLSVFLKDLNSQRLEKEAKLES